MARNQRAVDRAGSFFSGFLCVVAAVLSCGFGIYLLVHRNDAYVGPKTKTMELILAILCFAVAVQSVVGLASFFMPQLAGNKVLMFMAPVGILLGLGIGGVNIAAAYICKDERINQCVQSNDQNIRNLKEQCTDRMNRNINWTWFYSAIIIIYTLFIVYSYVKWIRGSRLSRPQQSGQIPMNVYASNPYANNPPPPNQYGNPYANNPPPPHQYGNPFANNPPPPPGAYGYPATGQPYESAPPYDHSRAVNVDEKEKSESVAAPWMASPPPSPNTRRSEEQQGLIQNAARPGLSGRAEHREV